jgi:hypothetical protein
MSLALICASTEHEANKTKSETSRALILTEFIFVNLWVFAIVKNELLFARIVIGDAQMFFLQGSEYQVA